MRLRDLTAVLADAAERGRSVQTQARRILHHDKYAAIGAALFAHDEDLVLRIDREHLLTLDGADAGAVIRERGVVDLAAMEETPLRINGRHDPCLAPRAIPVMEAALACCVLDAMLDSAATI